MNSFERIIKVFDIVAPDVDSANITRDTLLKEELGLDSLRMLQMAIMLEDEFNVQLKLDRKLTTVNDVIEWIESL